MITILILCGLVIALAFAIAGYTGAPYLPILGRDVKPLLDLADLEEGQTLLDLGSGDGYLLRAAAKRGIKSIGYEINPIMVLAAKVACWRYRRLITIRLANFWNLKLPAADAIYVFLIPKFMDRLDHKLTSEITRPTKVISYAFEVPGRRPSKRTNNTFVYEYGRATKTGSG